MTLFKKFCCSSVIALKSSRNSEFKVSNHPKELGRKKDVNSMLTYISQVKLKYAIPVLQQWLVQPPFSICRYKLYNPSLWKVAGVSQLRLRN